MANHSSPTVDLASHSLRNNTAGVDRVEHTNLLIGGCARLQGCPLPYWTERVDVLDLDSGVRVSVHSTIRTVPSGEDYRDPPLHPSKLCQQQKDPRLQIDIPSFEGLQMTEYQSAISDPSAADIVWMGVGADHDSPRHWVRYGLLNGRIPVPPNLGRAHRLARSSTEEDILEAERILLSEGWYVPLYRHQQYYFVRNGLQGLQLEMSDWPLPGVHHPDKLTWASRSTGSDSLEGCKN